MFLSTRSLREKLLLVILATSGICVILTTVALTVFGYFNMKDKLITDLNLRSLTRADNVSAALTYNRPEEIAPALALSRSETEIAACVYQSDGLSPDALVAQYPAKATCPDLNMVIKRAGATMFENDRINSYQEIATQKNDKVGYIYVSADPREISQFFKTQTITAILIILTVFILSYFLGQILQRSISGPILKLVETTRKVSSERDYSIRAENFLEGEDIKHNEISILIDAFNNMLAEVEERRKLLLRKNQELVKSKEIAESANRAKSQFLANISHELRTPLNAVIGFSDIIHKQMLGPISNAKYIEYSKDINESGEHLLHIINDILDLSKAEAGKLEPALREINVKKTIDECITYVANRAYLNNITIKTNLPDDLPALIVDRIMFKRIIANLLSNAVKFTNRNGIISLSVVVRLNDKNENIFTITIEDNGIGMSRDNIELAFKSFVQLDGGLDRRYEGTGLGLPLTKKLVELHGGHIELQSKIGEGTKAIIKLYSPVVPY